VVERANSLPSSCGLCLHVVGATANLIGDALDSGMVGVNSIAISTPETPFGGVKESGYGHEGGIEGLEAYTVRSSSRRGEDVICRGRSEAKSPESMTPGRSI